MTLLYKHKWRKDEVSLLRALQRKEGPEKKYSSITVKVWKSERCSNRWRCCFKVTTDFFRKMRHLLCCNLPRRSSDSVCLLNCVYIKALQSHHRFYMTLQCMEFPQPAINTNIYQAPYFQTNIIFRDKIKKNN